MVIERDDVSWVNVGGLNFYRGLGDVTTIKIVKRHGPGDWIPYVEIWKGDYLYAEVAQHQCSMVAFASEVS